MKILFFGNSGAVPSPANGYTCFIVSIGGFLVLVDTGDNPVKSLRKAGEDPLALDVVVLTHRHVDHMGSFPSLVSALDCMARKKKLLVLAEADTAGRARKLLEFFDAGPGKISFEIEYIPGPFEIPLSGPGPVPAPKNFVERTITLLPGKHSVPTRMVLFREAEATLLYTSDYRRGGEAGRLSRSCTTLIHEATYPHKKLPEPTGHSSASEAGQAAREAGARLLFLCHLHPDMYAADSEAIEEARQFFPGKIISPRLFKWYTVG